MSPAPDGAHPRAPLGASRTMGAMEPCPACDRPFVLGDQPAPFLAHARQRHVEACTRPRRPVGRPTGLAPETIERIERDYRGGLGLRAIARALAAEGVPTADGGQWHASTVRAVLLRARRPTPAVLADLPEA